MIIQLVQAIRVNSRWFKESQQYAFTETRMSESGKKFYVVVISNVEYEIPEYAVALMSGDIPSTDIRSSIEKLEDYVERDPTEELLGKKDTVLAAKEFLGIDIGAKPMMDQADYDQRALASIGAINDIVVTTDEDRQTVGVNEIVKNEVEDVPDEE